MNTIDNPAPMTKAFPAAEVRYRQLFETATDGLLILEADTGRVSDANPALGTLLGLTSGELAGKPVWEIDALADLIPSAAKLAELRGTGTVPNARLPLETKDGRKLSVEFVSQGGEAGEGRVMHCVFRELTARLRAEDELRRRMAELEQRVAVHQELEAKFIAAQKVDVIGQLASGVAHDFNNILAVIMGYTDLIMGELEKDSPLLKYTQEVRRASECATGLSQQLLVFSRRQTVQPAVLNLNTVINDLVKILQRLIGETIELEIVADKHIGHLKADAGQVCQVLMNLVVNARDAMPNGGRLVIATKNVVVGEADARADSRAIPGDYVMLSVRDTGTGMDDAVKARIFEAFFTTKPPGKGTGLGLATCEMIVRQSGGHIAVCSEVGKGSTFRVYFPRVGAPPEVAARPTPGGPLRRGTETLLFVEDEPSVRQMACGVLEALGYQVLSASNGQEALNVAREHTGSPIRLVVTDVIMPLMGGKLMAEWLKTTYPDLKILFISGYTDDMVSHHGVVKTRSEFLPKPYTTAALASKVRELLDNG